MPVRPRKVSDFKPIIGNLAQNSHYQVEFGILPTQLMSYLSLRGVDSRFIAETAGLLCFNAFLPASSMSTFTTDGNHMGIQEKFANVRLYDPITLDFYVDRNYKMLNFLEYWIEFISSGSYNNQRIPGENSPINPNSSSYFIRMQYPKYYKAESVKIIKFDRDYRKEIEYNFRGLFLESISAPQIGYTNSDILKVSATFQYDRYIAGKTNTFNQFIAKDSNGKRPNDSVSNPDSQQSIQDLLQTARETYVFSPTPLTQNSSAQSPTTQANPAPVK